MRDEYTLKLKLRNGAFNIAQALATQSSKAAKEKLQEARLEQRELLEVGGCGSVGVCVGGVCVFWCVCVWCVVCVCRWGSMSVKSAQCVVYYTLFPLSYCWRMHLAGNINWCNNMSLHHRTCVT